jgi:hypothetical protein
MSAKTEVHQYQLEVTRAEDGVGFGRRDVPDSDLESAREQILFNAQRLGRAGPQLDGLVVGVEPLFQSAGSDQIRGARMAVGQGPDRVELTFGLKLFEPCAARVTADLLQSEQLAPEDHVNYRVFARPATASRDGGAARDRVQREPLVWTDGQLEPWLAASTPDGPVGDRDYPVFVLEQEVLMRARELSWRGGQVEGGCWLVGSLLRQRQPRHEIFGVLHTVLEACGTTHDRYGLKLSSETYVRLAGQLERRRKRLGRPEDLAMGFHHCHPFSPSELLGHSECGRCGKQADCKLTSAFLSQEDARFHSALFGRTPFAVEMVLGLSPRDEFDLRMYCLDGGQFRRRGFYRVAQPPRGALGEFHSAGRSAS